ncbi:MAG TPA: SDR family NAD(P)-dependent oxidoreductase [Ottowia sp.]|uniref:SDR family NAD(P)-dependent oxidoreductase n=1 Tax=Ottowia sp. TaxID=1898956 RepID=UPI002BA6902E|nr:SDR family NAD(P)-dependent oxidoreductase [Ottowia sp.]HMN22666.1 SDR family NAD(P)-dependent oxidoreductase [Ottowia sp.]
MSTPSLCAIIGIGPGDGSALARRFSIEGQALALLSRSTGYSEQLVGELGSARAYACDAGQPEQVAEVLAHVAREQGAPETLIYNAGSGVWGSVEDVSAGDLEAAWRLNVLGAFAAARAVAPAMKERGRGNIIFIGATASLRGGAGTAAFAQAKAAQRTLAESMARHWWSAGIHVALIIIDGVVDLPRTRQRMSERPDSFFVQPDGVAAIAWSLTQQDRSAWSFEVQARPFGEKW